MVSNASVIAGFSRFFGATATRRCDGRDTMRLPRHERGMGTGAIPGSEERADARQDITYPGREEIGADA